LEEDSKFTDDFGLEQFVGIRIYSTNTTGIFGQVKYFPSDFVVEEITPNGDLLQIDAPDTSRHRNEEKYVKFTTFTLIKKNMDTILAARQIAKILGIPFNEVTWAGLKDNRAITAQRMCIRGDYINKLGSLQLDNMKIRDIRPSKHSFSIGNLWGNHFNILIRYIGDINAYKNHDRFGNLKSGIVSTTPIYDEDIDVPMIDSTETLIENEILNKK
jgi:tRNA pseudouridine13 synthase